jgi:hypothetical protein
MSRRNDGDPALRRAFQMLSDDATPGADCPPPDRLWEAAHGGLSAVERRDVVEHTSECAACAEAWRLAAALPPDEGRDAVEEAVPRRSYGSYLAAAASVLILIGVASTLRTWVSSPKPGFRDAERGEIRSLVPDNEPLVRSDCWLRWTPGPRGTQYHLTVTSEGLDVLVDVDALDSPRFLVPEGALSDLDSGARLLWQVTAAFPDGGEVSSETFVNFLE